MLNQLREGIFSMRSLGPKSSLTRYSEQHWEDVYFPGHHLSEAKREVAYRMDLGSVDVLFGSMMLTVKG